MGFHNKYLMSSREPDITGRALAKTKNVRAWGQLGGKGEGTGENNPAPFR